MLVEDVLNKGVVDGYAGDLSPQDAFERLGGEADCVLIDVRTRAEWAFVGVCNLETCGKAPVLVEWQCYPDMAVNEDFVSEVKAAMAGGGASASPDWSLLFLCRSGVRSVAAAQAMTASGFTQSFNVTQGFEGGLDDEGHRGVGGWKALGLPWMQR